MNTFTLLGTAAFALVLLSMFPVGRQVLRSCFMVDPALVTVAPGLRAACGMFLVLYVAQATGFHQAGTPAALGVLLTNLADFSEPYAERLKAMLLTALVTAAAVLLGGLVAGNAGWHLAMALVVAAHVGFAGAIGPRSGLVALFCLALFSLYSSTAVPVEVAFTAAGWYLAGGMASAIVACLAWPFARFYPTRRKLAVGFQQLAAACHDHGGRRADLRVVTAIQAAAAAIAGSRTDDDTRQWLADLLDEVEACRVLVVALGQRSTRLVANAAETALIERLFVAAGAICSELAHALAWNRNDLRLQAAFRDFEVACAANVEPEKLPLIETLLERLGKATLLLRGHSNIGRAADQAGELMLSKPVSAHVAGPALLAGLVDLRSHLRWRDIHARHALKFAGTYTVGTLLALGPLNSWLDGHGFWIPLTVAWVCKPDVAGSISRFSMRLCGTVLGALLAALLLHFVTTPVLLMLLTALGAFVMGATLFANYSVTVIGVTVLVLSLSASVGRYTEELADARLLATLLGCALVLLSAYILPVRTGTAAPVQLAVMAARLRELLGQAGRPETAAPRHPLAVAVQRHRLATVAALAAAEAEPRAPWERDAVHLELRMIADVLEGLEHVALRLDLSVVLGARVEDSAAARLNAEQEVVALERRLAGATLP